METGVVYVFLAAMITAVATGLGALPFVFMRQIGSWWLGIANASAAGLMLGATHNLIEEGTRLAPGRAMIGILIGLAAIVVSDRLIRRRNPVEIAGLRGDGAAVALLILGVMTAHSFAEGVGVGVAFADTAELGIFITTAIAIHNIPEGLAICLVLIPRGTPVWKAGLWSVVTSLPQPLMAVPAFLFVTAFAPLLPVGLGIAAGAMIWIVFSELIPEALEKTSGNAVGIAVTLSMVALWVFQLAVFGHG
jgi:zinc transporter, ZIP family